MVVVQCLRQLESERPRTWRSVPVKDGTVHGWHVGRIPWRAIKDWALQQGLIGPALNLLADVIHRLDDEREEKQATDFAALTGG